MDCVQAKRELKDHRSIKEFDKTSYMTPEQAMNHLGRLVTVGLLVDHYLHFQRVGTSTDTHNHGPK